MGPFTSIRSAASSRHFNALFQQQIFHPVQLHPFTSHEQRVPHGGGLRLFDILANSCNDSKFQKTRFGKHDIHSIGSVGLLLSSLSSQWILSAFCLSEFSVRSQLDRSVHSVILSNFSVKFFSDHQFFSWFSISISSASLSVTSILVNGPLHKHYECSRSCRYFNAIFWQQIFDPLQLHLPFHHDSYLVTWGFLA